MPVRIYDIAKKLGIESKRVLARARELGITGVKQASSSLDKITAEYLENEIGGKSSDTAESEQSGGAEPVVIVPQQEQQQGETTTSTSGTKSKRTTDTAAATETPAKKATTKKASKQKAKPTTDSKAKEKTAQTKSTAEAGTEKAATKKTSTAKKTKATTKTAEGAQKAKTAKQPPAHPTEEDEEERKATAPTDEVAPAKTPIEEAPAKTEATEPPPAEAEPAEAEAGPTQVEPEPAPLQETKEEAPAPAEPAIEEANAGEPEGEVEKPTEPESEAPDGALPSEQAPAPEEPPTPPKPKVGDKIGFIQLPNRPSQRREDRGQAKSSEKRAGQPAGGRGDRRGEQTGAGRGTSGAQRSGRGASGEGARRGDDRRQRASGSGQAAKAPSTKAPSKVSAPANAEVITLKQPIIVRDLAEKLGRKPFQLIADLMEMGVFANVNQSIDEDTAKRVCAKYNYRFEVEKRERGAGVVKAPSPTEVRLDEEDKPEDLRPRPPVITIMGHVDHGKTTLLDKIRKADVVAGEEGGMTQHIGAYTIAVPHPERPEEIKQITFLDTPGHEAFSAMRSRGTNVTDIVILVVAADDGVMPQTVEALNHAQAANVPVIVAVNKCDHPNATPQKTRQQFQAHGLVPEEWGGQTIFQDISAATGDGIPELLEMISLQAEVLELKANPKRNAVGTVIESALEPGGPVATVIVRKGTLRVGEAVLCGQLYGRVRALIDDQGKRLKEAGPSVAVKVLGLSGVPDAGEEFAVVKNERLAREIADERSEEVKTGGKTKRGKVTLESLFDQMAAEQAKTLKAVIKADTQGSAEAIVDALKKIESDKVSLEVIHNGVGSISESDILLASASKAIIIGFHTKIDSGGVNLAKREGVQIKQHTIIYQLIDDVRATMAGMLEPVEKENILGTAEVRQIFSLTKTSKVAGCMVTDGRIAKGRLKVLRNNKVIHDGTTQSLRRFQDEVNEVRSGLECGIRVSGFDQFQVGDQIQSYYVEKVPQQL